MDRRTFFWTTVGYAGGMATVKSSPFVSSSLARVTLVRDPSSVNMGNTDEGRVSALFDRLLRIHYDVADPVEVFRMRFSPKDRVGIKVNCLSGRRMSTHSALVDVIVKRLIQAEIPAENILIWDRLNNDLRQGGFKLNPLGNPVACAGCDIIGYENDLTVYRSIGSLFTKAVTRWCTAQINVPVMKDHGIVGVTLGMKNFFGAIHNPNKYHHLKGDPYVADLYSHPDIGGMVRMTVIDALEVQCEGGPPFQPDWCEDYGGLLISEDPVALDRLGWKMIEDLRKKGGLPSLAEANREPLYIRRAAELKLGTDRLDIIELRES